MDLLIAEASGTTDAGQKPHRAGATGAGRGQRGLYPQGSNKAVNNGALLKTMDMSSVTVLGGTLVLLANMQGRREAH